MTKTKFLSILGKTNIDFISRRRFFMALSVIAVIASIAIIAIRGINWGLDFTGGTMVEVQFDEAVEIDTVRETLTAAGFDRAQAQHYGQSSDVIIRVPLIGDESANANVSNEVMSALSAMDTGVQMQSVGFVGPQVGAELVNQGSLALLTVIICILIYVTLRFEWRLAMGTIAALAHDPLIVLGLFALFQWEFDLTVLAALLAVLGYSVNDTVVVLDRIRENFRTMRRSNTIEVMNTAINDTLSRTIVTSGTTLISTLILLFFGGPVIYGFALALTFGILIGTYSSIFIASGTALELGLQRDNLLRDSKPVDHMP